MVLKRRCRIMAGLLLAGLVVSLPLAAQQYNPSGNRAYSRDEYKGGNGVDLDSAVERIRKKTGGRVLHAETMNNQGNREHRVRIITDRGEVKRYRVDAGSGAEVPPGKRRR